jgi:hypothetical protein
LNEDCGFGFEIRIRGKKGRKIKKKTCTLFVILTYFSKYLVMHWISGRISGSSIDNRYPTGYRIPVPVLKIAG